MPKLTPKQAKIVKAKVEATVADIPQREWAPSLYPDANPKSAEVLVSRELNKVNVQEALQLALAKKGLTVDKLAGVVVDAMGAEKTVIIGNGEQAMADAIPDHSIRLKAAGMAAGFMGLNKNAEGGTSYHFHQHVADQREKYGI